MAAPIPTPALRIIHVDNLTTVLHRGALHAPNHVPRDGRPYRTIHNVDIQNTRRVCAIPCGPRGVIHDYVPFYFGPRSPMLLQLHTNRVAGYSEGQEPLIYLVTTAQAVQQSGIGYVFSDGHGIAAFTSWFDILSQLDQVDWTAAYARIWRDTNEDMDRQRRKQAEFLIHQNCPWELIHEIVVISDAVKLRAEQVLAGFGATLRKPVRVDRAWYY